MHTTWLTLKEEYKNELEQLHRKITYKKGELVFSMGEEYKGFYLVKSGIYKVYILDSEGKEAILHIFQKDELIATPPIFEENGFYPGYAEVISSGSLYFFPAKGFQRFLLQNAKASFIFASLVVKNVNYFREKIYSLCFLSVKDRIILFLKDMNALECYINLPIPKQQLALLLGTTPESVSRAFTSLVKENILLEKDGTYKLLSIPEILKEQIHYK